MMDDGVVFIRQLVMHPETSEISDCFRNIRKF